MYVNHGNGQSVMYPSHICNCLYSTEYVHWSCTTELCDFLADITRHQDLFFFLSGVSPNQAGLCCHGAQYAAHSVRGIELLIYRTCGSSQIVSEVQAASPTDAHQITDTGHRLGVYSPETFIAFSVDRT